MNRKQDAKNKIAEQPFKEEMPDLVVIYEGIAMLVSSMEIICLTEIITPQPYSVFALCKHYEYFQRN